MEQKTTRKLQDHLLFDEHDGDVPSQTTHSDSRMAALEQWFYKYNADQVHDESGATMAEMQDDELDLLSISHRIEHLAASVTVFDRFCEDCWKMLGSWPTIGENGSCICRFDSIGLEARAQRGCMFCAFILRVLMWPGIVDSVRQTEARLCELGKFQLSSVWITNGATGTSMNGHISRPGKLKGPRDSEAFFHEFWIGSFYADLLRR